MYISLIFAIFFCQFGYSTGLFGETGNAGKVKLSPTGPCTLNNDGLECDQNGYYSVVQCSTESCYCVTPHHALVSYDTRTSSNKIAPKCGTCLTYLQKLFANGDPPQNSFIPKCDVGKGDFEPLQCNSHENICYCVDTQSGRELPSTRTSLNNTRTLNCMKIDFAIDSMPTQNFDKSTTKPVVEVVARPECALNRDSGHVCSQNKTSVKWWFDTYTFQCLPFEHKGCGGNKNVFQTKSDCYSSCVFMDYFSCALQSQPARKSNGQQYTCGSFEPMAPPNSTTTPKPPGPALNDQGCPNGYVCQYGAFFGICCDEKITNKFNEAYRPKCANKKSAHSTQDDGYEAMTLGKSCSDNFCPKGHTCETNSVFAFCCPI